MADITSLSDADLMKVIGGDQSPRGADVKSLSDADILRLAGLADDQPKSVSGGIKNAGSDVLGMLTGLYDTGKRAVGDVTSAIQGNYAPAAGDVLGVMKSLNPLLAAKDNAATIGNAIANPQQAATAAGNELYKHPVSVPLAFAGPWLGEVGAAGRASRAAKLGENAAALTERQALSQRTGVPFSQAQQTGDQAALNAEDAMRHGGRGGQAQQTAGDFSNQQTEALRNAVPQDAANAASADIGETLGSEFQKAHAAHKAVVDKAYTDAFDPDALKAAGAPANAPGQVMAWLGKVADAAFDPMLPPDASVMPRTTRLLGMLDRAAEQYGQVGTSWKRVDGLRRNITGALQDARRAGGEDYGGIKTVLNAFDDEIGKANPLLNQARERFGSYADVFRPQTTNAPGVNNILKQFGNAENPGAAMYKAMFGEKMKAGAAEPFVKALQQVYGGPQSAGMDAVRQGALHRLAVDAKGTQVSPRVLANNIDAALGPQSPVRGTYEALFDAATLDKLRDIAKSARVIDPTARNASKTSYTLMDQARGGLADLARHKAAAAGTALGSVVGGPFIGGPAGLLAGHIADRTLNNMSAMRGANAANRAFNPALVPAPNLNAAQSVLANAQRGAGWAAPGIAQQQQQQQPGAQPMWLHGIPIFNR